jgi:hypothetical protein
MTHNPHITVIGPDGQAVDGMPNPDQDRSDNTEGNEIHKMVSSPEKVMRIGNMVKQLLEEVRAAPLDDASRARLKEIQQRAIVELSDGLSPELREELDRITLPFAEDVIPSDAELRIAQAQLVGWLEGLFHGLQAALFAQQMAAQAQLQQMSGRALPPGASSQQGSQQSGAGQYL